MYRRLLALLGLTLFVAACPPSERPRPTSTPSPTPVEQREDALVELEEAARPELVDDFREGDWVALERATRYSLRFYAGQRLTEPYVFGPRTVTAAQMRAALGDLLARLEKNPTPEELAEWMEHRFDVLETAASARGEMLFTGYFEPVIEASLTRRRGYDVPIYERPRDMVYVDLSDFDERFEGERIAGRLQGHTLVPYWSREDIWSRQALEHKGLELAWAKDPVDAFFLEVQGSGTLQLPDGSYRRIGYAGSNGRPYDSIGRLLIDEGRVPASKMSMQAIRKYLDDHPDDVDRVLHHNQSFVFFRFLDGEPLGSLGYPVTPLRSMAIDMKLLPKGALAFFETQAPSRAEDGRVEAGEALHRFVLAQDRGGAIQGTGRADVFWGRGEKAAFAAGHMQQGGRLYFLVPKDVDSM